MTDHVTRSGYIPRTVPELFFECAGRHSLVRALQDPHRDPPLNLPYSEFADMVRAFGAGLLSLGIKRGDRVGLFADNRPRWLVGDLAMLSCGIINVPRGADSAVREIWYILNHSEAVAAIVQDARLLKRLGKTIGAECAVRVIILMDDSAAEATPLPGVHVVNFASVLEQGRGNLEAFEKERVKTRPDDTALIVYTSGTTGLPKGVMLTHANLVHQADNIDLGVPIEPGDRFLSILPMWHVYERVAEYLCIRHGGTIVYSDKRSIRDDMVTLEPEFLPCVPRIWEMVYDGVRERVRKDTPCRRRIFRLFEAIGTQFVRARRDACGMNASGSPEGLSRRLSGGLRLGLLMPLHFLGDALVFSQIRKATGAKMKAAVSGGGSLPAYLDDFFEIVGLPILNGYGLTETSPVVVNRRVNWNVRRTVGPPMADAEVEIRGEDGSALRAGEVGVIWLRGPQIMKGYYKNEDMTRSLIDADGWFNTGDLGWMTHHGDLVISGRAKDTIVLMSGENVEPEPLEGAASRSRLVSQIVVVGQDQKTLGALVVPNVHALAETLGLKSSMHIAEVIQHPEAARLVRESIQSALRGNKGFKVSEQITRITLLAEPFSEANEMLTKTLKPRRNVILKRYAAEIAAMFEKQHQTEAD